MCQVRRATSGSAADVAQVEGRLHPGDHHPRPRSTRQPLTAPLTAPLTTPLTTTLTTPLTTPLTIRRSTGESVFGVALDGATVAPC